MQDKISLQNFPQLFYDGSQNYSTFMRVKKLKEQNTDLEQYAKQNIVMKSIDTQYRRFFEYATYHHQKFKYLLFHSNSFHFTVNLFCKSKVLRQQTAKFSIFGGLLNYEIDQNNKIIGIENITTEVIEENKQYYLKSKYPKYGISIDEKSTHALVVAKHQGNIVLVLINMKDTKNIQKSQNKRITYLFNQSLIHKENIFSLNYIPPEFRAEILEFTFSIDNTIELRSILYNVIQMLNEIFKDNQNDVQIQNQIIEDFATLFLMYGYLVRYKRLLIQMMQQLKEKFLQLRISMIFQKAFEAYILKSLLIFETGDLDENIQEYGKMALGLRPDIQINHIQQFHSDIIPYTLGDQKIYEFVKQSVQEQMDKGYTSNFTVLYLYNYSKIMGQYLDLQTKDKPSCKDVQCLSQGIFCAMLQFGFVDFIKFKFWRDNNEYFLSFQNIMNIISIKDENLKNTQVVKKCYLSSIDACKQIIEPILEILLGTQIQSQPCLQKQVVPKL